ncbi:Pfmc-2TM Maurer's cleft two transmembrane protein [Plasmodium sp. gorilla clade G1]|nr:Pfmc-2TM Maurer's cleft two transmembrane protein [Plasmodium sp. gorilla clade G1]
MFHYIYKIYICASNLFNNNGVENWNIQNYHTINGGRQFRMLAQKNTNKKIKWKYLKGYIVEKGSKKKNPDAQISDLVNLVDNMNITQEKKDEIKNLTLKYMNSDDIKEKNKSINELKKYSNNEGCKEYIDNYLMHLRMQNDIKCLKTKNLWNNIWIVSMTVLLIIIMIACAFSVGITESSAFLPACFLLIFITYMYGRFLPELKIAFNELKTKLYTFFQKKK